MGIKALTEGLKAANVEMSKLAEANAALVETLSPTGGGGGGGGGGAATPPPPPVVNFNTTLVTQVDLNRRPSVRTGEGVGPRGDEELQRAFAFFQMSWADKSAVYQQQILEEFRRLKRGLNGLGAGVEFRMGGN